MSMLTFPYANASFRCLIHALVCLFVFHYRNPKVVELSGPPLQIEHRQPTKETTRISHRSDMCHDLSKYSKMCTKLAPVVRFLQLPFSITVIALYGQDVHHDLRDQHTWKPKWGFALVLGTLAASFSVMDMFLRSCTSRRCLWVQLDLGLTILWLTLFGIFANMYLPAKASCPESGLGDPSKVHRMRSAIWIDLVNLLLWTYTLFTDWPPDRKTATKPAHQNRDPEMQSNPSQPAQAAFSTPESPPDQEAPDEDRPDEERPDEGLPDEVLPPAQEAPDQEAPDQEAPDQEAPTQEALLNQIYPSQAQTTTYTPGMMTLWEVFETARDNLDQTCAICCDDVELEKQVQLLSCGHWFHSHCISPWLYDRSDCPVCRQEIS